MLETKHFNIALLPGDGAGLELATQVHRILKKIEQVREGIIFAITEEQFGRSAISTKGKTLSESTLQTYLKADAVVICGCDGLESERALLRLRQELGVYANIRPIKFPSSSLHERSPFKSSIIDGIDITFVRDLTSGVYYGERLEADAGGGRAYDTTEYSRGTIERLARWAGTLARLSSPPKGVHSVDKFNIMATSRLWRNTVSTVFAREFPDVRLDHFLVDHAAMLLASTPTLLNGIVLTENLFGDILSDQIGAVVGSQDVLGSGGLSCQPRQPETGKPGIFEPVNLKTTAQTGLGTINPLGMIQAIAIMLDHSFGLVREAAALEFSIQKTLDPPERIGSNIRTPDIGGTSSTIEFMDTLLQHFDFALEALNSADLAANGAFLQMPLLSTSMVHQPGRPMGIIEKILTHAAVGLYKAEVKPGDMICVAVDWIITSELLWGGMEKTYDQMNRPRPYRNDRMWIALDHIVDPRTNHLPKQKGLIAKAERLRQEAKIIDYLPANTSIMHTDFTRERAQPGHIIVGSDSHTCSAGSMGAFAVGLGAADVVLPMVTGETWFRVPAICNIHIVGNLPFGIGGKDVMLYILGHFKRNTIAFQRAVEYTGPGLSELSMDARFAIANMTTEFGGVGACFDADEITAAWISKRKASQHKDRGMYFKPDPDAMYAERRIIDLSLVSAAIALYPNPDDVVPIQEKEGMHIDGCFIGACTTTEEDLVLAALVLEAGLASGLSPVSRGKRRVTPGSLIITSTLRQHGLLDVYKRAGFEIGAPGCSYCVGINDVDVAGAGEVWLSSQNRNFRNRMGQGSFGYMTSATAVAASSFGMKVLDPTQLLSKINKLKYTTLIKSWKNEKVPIPNAVEPNPRISKSAKPDMLEIENGEAVAGQNTGKDRIIRSRVQRFSDNIDTDAIIPAQFMPGIDNADLGSHCFEFYRPEFRQKVANGAKIIVGNRGFGSGSSREDAVRALQGVGIEAVIAESFAFIYERNQLNMGLFNVTLQDPEFYENAVEGAVVTIDKDRCIINIEGVDKEFRYKISELEMTLLDAGGVLPLYQKYEKTLFRHLVAPKRVKARVSGRTTVNSENGGCGKMYNSIEW